MMRTWKLVSLGDRKYRLETPSGRELGWIHGHAVGLVGLRDDAEALTCAPGLRKALDDMLAREYPDRYRPLRDVVDLRLVHDGAYEWIAAGSVPIARVHRSPADNTKDRLTVEFVLPSYASEQVVLDGAAILATTFRRGTCHLSSSPHKTHSRRRQPRSRFTMGQER